jgi:hypothetical protein
MATWKKVLREDLAVGTDLITYKATSADENTLNLILADNGSGTDTITLTLGDNLSVANGVTDSAATLNVTGLADVATSGDYGDLTNTPTIPSAIFSTIAVPGEDSIVAGSATDTLTLEGSTNIEITTDGDDTVTFSVTGLADVATSGDYGDLSNTPTIGNGAITFTGDSYVTPTGNFTLNQTGAQAISFAHATYSNTASTNGQTPAFGGSFNVVSSLTYNVGGHITAANIGTVTLPEAPATPTVDQVANSSTSFLLLQPGTSTDGDDLDPKSAFGDIKWVVDGSGNGTLEIGGDFVVSGTTTILQTENVIVEDKLITLGNPDSGDGTTTTANGGGIEIKSGDPATVAYPSFTWSSTGELSGWEIQDHAAASANAEPKTVSTMQFAATGSTPTATARGDFRYDTTTDVLYVCIA